MKIGGHIELYTDGKDASKPDQFPASKHHRPIRFPLFAENVLYVARFPFHDMTGKNNKALNA